MTESIKTDVEPVEYPESWEAECFAARVWPRVRSYLWADDYFEDDLAEAAFNGDAILPLKFVCGYPSIGNAEVDFERIVGWLKWFTVNTMRAVPTEIIEEYGKVTLYYTIFECALEEYVEMIKEEEE